MAPMLIRPEIAALLRRCDSALGAAASDADLVREAGGDGALSLLISMIELPRQMIAWLLAGQPDTTLNSN